MKEADWHITDTFTKRVVVLRETPTEAQVRAASGDIWVPRSELSDVR